MRNLGICASILAVSNIVAFTSPAFAQDTAKPSDEKAPAEATPAKPADAPAPAADAPSPAGDDALVAVHVDSPVPVSLERRAPGGTTWENVCTTPCDVKTSRFSEYRIVGTDLNASKPFMIDGTKEKVNLSVSPGSKARADVGLYILVAGGVVTIAGIAVMFLSAGKDDVFQSQSDGQTHNSYLNSLFFGGALVMTGLAAGIFGAGWMLGNKNSDVSGDVSKTIDEKPAPGGSGSPGGPGAPAGGSAEIKLSTSNTPSRQPTWSTQKNPGLPQVMSVPFFAGTF
jgi:hypothetical protein